MGGKVVLLGGDFKQLFPAVRKGKAAQIIENCLKSSPLWLRITYYNLRTNMQARPEEIKFCQWLLQIGTDTTPKREHPSFEGAIKIPQHCIIRNDIVSAMFDDANEPNDFVSKVILTPTNDDSLTITDNVLNLLPGQSFTYNSADDVLCDDDAERHLRLVEFLNSLTPSGMALHSLKKVLLYVAS